MSNLREIDGVFVNLDLVKRIEIIENVPSEGIYCLRVIFDRDNWIDCGDIIPRGIDEARDLVRKIIKIKENRMDDPNYRRDRAKWLDERKKLMEK